MRPIYEIATEMIKDWTNPAIGARPYGLAMLELTDMKSMCGADDAKTVIIYFLSNATTWRGETARRIKKELKEMIKNS